MKRIQTLQEREVVLRGEGVGVECEREWGAGMRTYECYGRQTALAFVCGFAVKEWSAIDALEEYLAPVPSRSIIPILVHIHTKCKRIAH